MGEGGAGAIGAADSPLASYARWAAGIVTDIGTTDHERLAYLGLGLASEAGEVADVIKRRARDGRLDAAALADELGDVVYYWACLCAAIDRSPDEVLAASRAKIAVRLATGAA